ncbi:threonine/serine exporter family protein [Limosilactobacillus difficilis]|uniref:threonine/serine ThrE exporter family protein n=1 Tax=Limosilactobacillus difficilis TaxID=2991838 RepID=UPI0024B8DDE6|nr:threonine/serine exporter family protein [Limosilactobacillus difficilis]
MKKDIDVDPAIDEKIKQLSQAHHMRIPWHDFMTADNVTTARRASLGERALIVGRIGLMLLACGTGAWRVRDSMNVVARKLGMTCSADIGLTSLEYTCMDDNHSYTQSLSLPGTSVNTTRLTELEKFIRLFDKRGEKMTIGEIHKKLTHIANTRGLYSPIKVGLAAALACAAFIFLLGGGPVEMVCCFVGAFFGNFVRRELIDRHITLLACIAVAIAVAGVAYSASLALLRLTLHVNAMHEAGYIGAMLFIIPGFPFITSGLDMSKLDMKSGLERLAYSLLVIVVATMAGWFVAMCLHLNPRNFEALGLTPLVLCLLRVVMSFCGVFGFSMMFNSTLKLATIAGLIGAVANTLRLELVDLVHMPSGAAAFIGALVAGLLASLVRTKVGYPRIALTVPSIVIMVPGLYMYRAMYNMGLTSVSIGAYWTVQAMLIVFALPLGLITARILTDDKWRHNG